jgi:transcriptional regulator with XRE-family HTH domain
MGDDFKFLLREFRENKRISQSDLADSLDCSRAIISSWEDGSDLPSRENIIRVGKAMKSNPEEVDRLLVSASYAKLSSGEVVGIVNTNLLFAGVGSKEDFSNFLSSTGTVIGNAIGSIDEKTYSIEKKLEEIIGIRSKDPLEEVKITEEIDKRLEPVVTAVKSIREEIVPQLESTKEHLAKSNEFMRRNADFFVSAIEGEGLIKVVNAQIESIDKRLDKVESQINVSKDRVIAIISVIITVISACVALASLAILAYKSFGG